MPGSRKPSTTIPGVMQLDLDLRAESINDGALRILQTIRPDWKPSDIVFTEYKEGISNTMIGCSLLSDTDLDDCVMVRLYGEQTSKFVDRDLEMLTMYVMNADQCSKALYCKFNNGIAYGFMPEKCLDGESVRDPHIGKLVAQEMVRMGAIKPLQYNAGISGRTLKKLNKLADKNLNIFTKTRELMFLIPESLTDPEKNNILMTQFPKLGQLQSELNLLERHLKKLNSPIVFCHGDLLLKNIVYNQTEDRCYFIDYEFSGHNFQAFEIATHFCEWAGVDDIQPERYPDRQTQLAWLTEFLKAYKSQQGDADTSPSQRDLQLLYVQVNKFTLIAHLFCGIWGLVQAKYSSLEFDYLKFSKSRLDWYFSTKKQLLDMAIPY